MKAGATGVRNMQNVLSKSNCSVKKGFSQRSCKGEGYSLFCSKLAKGIKCGYISGHNRKVLHLVLPRIQLKASTLHLYLGASCS